MGIFGLILGIVGLLAAIMGAVWPIGNLITIIGLVLAVVGIVLSAIDMKKSEKHGTATAGLVLSIIAVVIGTVMLIACSGTKSAINTAVTDIANTYSEQEINDMSPEEQESLANDIAENLISELTTN